MIRMVKFCSTWYKFEPIVEKDDVSACRAASRPSQALPVVPGMYTITGHDSLPLIAVLRRHYSLKAPSQKSPAHSADPAIYHRGGIE